VVEVEVYIEVEVEAEAGSSAAVKIPKLAFGVGDHVYQEKKCAPPTKPSATGKEKAEAGQEAHRI
jgi:hypothetical protein